MTAPANLEAVKRMLAEALGAANTADCITITRHKGTTSAVATIEYAGPTSFDADKLASTVTEWFEAQRPGANTGCPPWWASPFTALSRLFWRGVIRTAFWMLKMAGAR